MRLSSWVFGGPRRFGSAARTRTVRYDFMAMASLAATRMVAMMQGPRLFRDGLRLLCACS